MEWEQTTTADGILVMLKGTDKLDAIAKISRSKDWVTTDVQCPRHVVWRAEEDTVDMETQENFVRGASIHVKLQEKSLLTELRVSHSGIRGKIDLIGLYITEIYTTAIGGTFTPSRFPQKVNQLMAYLKMLQAAPDDEKLMDIDRIRGEILLFQLYKKKGERKLTSWLIEPTQEEIDDNWSNILYNREQLEEYVRTRTIPERNPITSPDFWECRRCEFYNRCYETDNLINNSEKIDGRGIGGVKV